MIRRERRLPFQSLIRGAVTTLALSGFLGSSAHAYFAADFEQRYFANPELLVTDHTLVRDEDNLFHLYYTVGIVGQGWDYPNNMIDFGHAVSPDLIHWTDMDRVLATIPNTWKDYRLWAPDIIPLPQGGHAMYYCGVDSFVAQATGVAYSADLLNWTDLSVSAPAYHPDTTWAEWPVGTFATGRDPFAFQIGDNLGLISTALAKAEYTGTGVRGAISLAYSTDGVSFVDAGFPMFVNDTQRVLESPSLYRRPDRYFLFFHESTLSGIRYMTSPNLVTGWDKTTTRILDPVGLAPSEVVPVPGGTILGRIYDANFGGTVLYGAKFDTLNWGTNTATFRNTNTLWDQWNIISGNAFGLQPAYGDRPFARGEPWSGVEGFFAINTAETYNGPINNNNPDAPAQPHLTGKLRSDPFTITGGHMRFLIGGGNNFDDLYIALVEVTSGTILLRTTGPDSNVLAERFWNLDGFQGDECVIEVVDMETSGPYGYIAIDGIQEGAGPPPITAVNLELAPAIALGIGTVHPSPTRGAASIPFQLARSGRARLAIYDVAGRVRRILLDDVIGAGAHVTRWDGRSADGSRVPAGVYFLRLESGSAASSLPLTVVR